MSDVIYRQDAIMAVRSHRLDINDPKKIVRKSYEDAIRELPSAEPERKTGEWIVKTDCEGKTRTCICGLCGHKTDKYTWKNPNYCSECGADMRGEEDE